MLHYVATRCTTLQNVVLLRLAGSHARESRARCTRGSAGDAPPAHATAMLHASLPRPMLYVCCTGSCNVVMPREMLHRSYFAREGHAPTANGAKCDVAVRMQCARACLRGLCAHLSVCRGGTETAVGCARICHSDERCGSGAHAGGDSCVVLRSMNAEESAAQVEAHVPSLQPAKIYV
jgi:hypothetical protein